MMGLWKGERLGKLSDGDGFVSHPKHSWSFTTRERFFASPMDGLVVIIIFLFTLSTFIMYINNIN